MCLWLGFIPKLPHFIDVKYKLNGLYSKIRKIYLKTEALPISRVSDKGFSTCTGCGINTSHVMVRHSWQWCRPLSNVVPLCGKYLWEEYLEDISEKLNKNVGFYFILSERFLVSCWHYLDSTPARSETRHLQGSILQVCRCRDIVIDFRLASSYLTVSKKKRNTYGDRLFVVLDLYYN